MEHLNHFFIRYKELQEQRNGDSERKKIRLAILCSYTLRGMEKVVSVLCDEAGLDAEIYMGGYQQIDQDVLNPSSDLYRFQPDMIFLLSDTQTLIGEEWFFFNSLSPEKQREKKEQILDYLITLAQNIKDKSSAKVVMHSLEVPHYSSLGIIDNKQQLGFIESVKQINASLTDQFKEDPRLFLFDFDQFCSLIGKEQIRDEKMYYLGDFKIDMKWLPRLANAWMAYILPLASLTKKCLVLDLDNTLWGGVIGEDGLEGIQLGPDPAGRPFFEFQKYLKALYQRGVILAVNSKNNYEDVMAVFEKHPYMILQKEHFASIQINWTDKASNIRQIAAELNIGTDSIVFFDDDPLNREIVRSELPEAGVPELPQDPSLYCKFLQQLHYFHSFFLSAEDRKKGEMYAQQMQRKSLERNFTDVSAYLKALEMEVAIEEATSFTIPRIAQLTQKTNQFNVTTRRYQTEQIHSFSESDDWLVVSLSLKDKFGDNGITGCALVEKKKEAWRVDTFLLSCRIIGREVEKALMEYIRKEAAKAGATILEGEYIATEKNKPAEKLFERCNFDLKEKSVERSVWIKKVSDPIAIPSFFCLNE